MSQNIIIVTQEGTNGAPLVPSYTKNGKTYSPPILKIVNSVDSSNNPIDSGVISTLSSDLSSQYITPKDNSGNTISNTTARTLGAINADYINALDFGLSPSNSDNTNQFQKMIDYAVSNGKTIYIPSGVYAITPPLNISGPLRIIGDGLHPLYGSFSKTSDAINIPTKYPYFSGTVISAVSNGNNIFNCSGGGYSFSGENFGCIFQTPFRNTGNVVNFYTGDIGLMSSSWKNCGVYGHDGDHYMFNLENMLYNIFENCMAYGGGMINSHTSQMQCGNSTLIRMLNMIIVGGSCNGYNFSADKNWSQQLNSLISVQCITNSQPYGNKVTPSSPTGSQKLLCCDSNCHQFSLISPDFESLVGSYSILPPDMTYVDIISGGLSTGFLYANSDTPSFSPEYLQGGTSVQSGYVDSSSTTGTIKYPNRYWHTINPVVVITGVGVNAKLSKKPSADSFSYVLDSPGSFSWISMGR